MAEITREQIREKLASHYAHGIGPQRELIEVESMSSHGTLGAIFFALDGSPPKGYAIWVPGHHALWLYDAWGKRFREMNNIELKEDSK